MYAFLANSFQNIYSDGTGPHYFDESGKRRNLYKRQQKATRLSYEDISQMNQNAFLSHNENMTNLHNNIEKRNTDSDSLDDDISFENGFSLSVPNNKKSSSSVTPR